MALAQKRLETLDLDYSILLKDKPVLASLKHALLEILKAFRN